jgi:hypothetical protein
VLFNLVPVRRLMPFLLAFPVVAALARLVRASASGVRPHPADIAWTAGTAAAGVALGAGLMIWYLRRHPSWIRVCATGLEIAYRGAPVSLAWPGLTVARVRRRYPLSILEIIPTDMYAIRADLPSRDLPPIRDTPLGPAFVLSLVGFHPGTRALRAALIAARSG